MAKIAKVKKREVSIHSRAARRNASPPSKDLAVKSTTRESEYQPWMHNAQNAGISKKKKTKTLTRQQRTRQQKGVAKADAVVGKLEKKIEDSKGRAKKLKKRALDWEDLNGAAKEVETKNVSKDEEEGRAEEDWEDEEEGGQMQDVDVQDSKRPVKIAGTEKSSIEEETHQPAMRPAAVSDLRSEDDEVL